MMRGERGSKRYSSDGFDGPSKKPRFLGPDEIEIRILIPSKVAGSIIGKGGSNIARLRTEAKVIVPDCPGPERMLTIVATEENALKVVNEVLPNLYTYLGAGRSKGSSDDDNEVDLRMLVHQSQAGCVIGKAGFKVKQLREKTGARIKIYSKCCPDSTDRVVQINGTPTTAVDCLKEVLELLKTSPIKGPETQYDPRNCDEFYADEYGGYGSVGAAPGGRGYPPREGPRGGMPPPRYAGAPRGGPPAGGPGGYGYDDGGYEPKPRMGNGAGMSRTSTQVTIPKDMAGAIIGTGGSRIRKVRADSGADITIDEPLPGSTDRIITITGTQSEIQMAQYLLQQCCQMFDTRK